MADSILETIGATPVVRLAKVVEPGAAQVYAKLEQFNPGGSAKDRFALAVVERAEREGKLRPGGTVVEATSGSTGIALAMVCAAKGYRCVLAMPEPMSLEKRALLRAMGAELVLTPERERMVGAIARAEALAREREGAFVPRQFSNPLSAASAEAIALELCEAAEVEGGGVDAFAAGVGSGGTLAGIARVLRKRYPRCLIAAVEPRGCALLSGGTVGPHRQQGLGPGFAPELLDPSSYDRVVTVEDHEAWRMRERLAREEGILAGISSGSAAVAALALARELGSGKQVFTLFPDAGDRYFSLAEYFE